MAVAAGEITIDTVKGERGQHHADKRPERDIGACQALEKQNGRTRQADETCPKRRNQIGGTEAAVRMIGQRIDDKRKDQRQRQDHGGDEIPAERQAERNGHGDDRCTHEQAGEAAEGIPQKPATLAHHRRPVH